MSDISNTINNLKRLTQELAEEIKYDEVGPMFKFCKLIFDNLRTFVVILDLDGNIKYINVSLRNHLKNTGVDLNVGDMWFKCWDKSTVPITHPSKEAVETRTVVQRKVTSPTTGITYDFIVIPLIFNGVSGTICLFNKVN